MRAYNPEIATLYKTDETLVFVCDNGQKEVVFHEKIGCFKSTIIQAKLPINVSHQVVDLYDPVPPPLLTKPS